MVQKSRSFESYRDAESYCAAMDDDIRRGRYRDPNDAKRMVSEVATEWFAGKVNIRQSTLNRYRRDYEHYVAPALRGPTLGSDAIDGRTTGGDTDVGVTASKRNSRNDM